MMRRALLPVLVIVVTLAGCASAPPAENPPSISTPAPDAAARGPQVVGEGQLNVTFAVRQPAETDSFGDGGGHFELERNASLTLELWWNATTPASAQVRVSLGTKGGAILRGPTGPSPLRFTVPNATAASYFISVSPAQEPGVSGPQTFSWRATAISAGGAS